MLFRGGRRVSCSQKSEKFGAAAQAFQQTPTISRSRLVLLTTALLTGDRALLETVHTTCGIWNVDGDKVAMGQKKKIKVFNSNHYTVYIY